MRVPKQKVLESSTRAGDSPVCERGKLTCRHLSAGVPTSSGAGHPSSGSSQASPAAAKKSFLGRFAEGYAKKDPVEQVAIGATVVGAAAGVEAATGILSKTADVVVTVATSPGRPAALEHPTRPVTPPAEGAGASNISSSPLNSP
jgi:hypothetical protein